MVTERRSAAAILAAAPLRLHLSPHSGVRFCSGGPRRTARQVFVYAVSEMIRLWGHWVSEHKPPAVPELVAKFTPASARLRRGYIRLGGFPGHRFPDCFASFWMAGRTDLCFGANAGDFRMRNLWTGKKSATQCPEGRRFTVLLQSNGLCSDGRVAMEPAAPRKKSDRRKERPRRTHTRSGRRESDPDERTECPWCTSRNIEVVATSLRCRCAPLWSVSPVVGKASGSEAGAPHASQVPKQAAGLVSHERALRPCRGFSSASVGSSLF